MNKVSQKFIAYINSKMLKYARDQSGYTLKEAAKSYTTPENLDKAEKGESSLTFKQFLKIARRYRRPPAFFYLNKPLKEELIPDFRTLESRDVKFTPYLRDQIFKIKEKRNLAVEYQNYDKQYDYFYINSIKIEEDHKKVAKKITKLLNIEFTIRKNWKNKYDALNTWKKSIENIGVLIFQISGVETEIMRGFSIPEIPYPTIVLNRNDSVFGRIFTLLHEFSHLMLNKGGICTYRRKDEEEFEIEKFCNDVAGEVLVPNNILRYLNIVMEHTNLKWENDELDDLKKIFWVSKEVILRRLLIMKKTTRKNYQELRNYWKSLPKPFKEAFKEPQYKKTVSTHSNNYIEIVLNAMHENKISPYDVSYYLSMDLKNLPKLVKHLKIKRSS